MQIHPSALYKNSVICEPNYKARQQEPLLTNMNYVWSLNKPSQRSLWAITKDYQCPLTGSAGPPQASE